MVYVSSWCSSEEPQLKLLFFIVDQTTTLIGPRDSIKLGLIMVNCFDSMKHVAV